MNELITDEFSEHLYSVLAEYMIDAMGFREYEIDEYSRIEYEDGIEYVDIYVYAELSYDNFMPLISELNNVVEELDESAYFEMVEPGIIVSRVWVN